MIYAVELYGFENVQKSNEIGVLENAGKKIEEYEKKQTEAIEKREELIPE